MAILKTTNEYDEELEEEQFEDPSLFRDAIALKDRDGNVISQWIMNLSVQSIDALNLEWCSKLGKVTSVWTLLLSSVMKSPTANGSSPSRNGRTTHPPPDTQLPVSMMVATEIKKTITSRRKTTLVGQVDRLVRNHTIRESNHVRHIVVFIDRLVGHVDRLVGSHTMRVRGALG